MATDIARGELSSFEFERERDVGKEMVTSTARENSYQSEQALAGEMMVTNIARDDSYQPELQEVGEEMSTDIAGEDSYAPEYEMGEEVLEEMGTDVGEDSYPFEYDIGEEGGSDVVGEDSYSSEYELDSNDSFDMAIRFGVFTIMDLGLDKCKMKLNDSMIQHNRLILDRFAAYSEEMERYGDIGRFECWLETLPTEWLHRLDEIFEAEGEMDFYKSMLRLATEWCCDMVRSLKRSIGLSKHTNMRAARRQGFKSWECRAAQTALIRASF